MLPQLKVYTTPNDIKYIMFEKSDIISDQIRTNGTWNPHCLEMADKVLAKMSGGRVIDVGAGFGTFTIPLALKYGPRFEFSVFEPLPVIHNQLCANILLNHLESVRTYAYVLGDKNETIEAPILDLETSGNDGAFSFKKEIHASRQESSSGAVDAYEMRTLDSFRFANVRLIKISTPGMELDVLNGMSETLVHSNFPPVLFESWLVEWYKESREKVMDFFASRGYEHYVMMSEHVMAFKTKSQYDFVMSDIPLEKLGAYEILEQSHDAASALINQAPLIEQ